MNKSQVMGGGWWSAFKTPALSILGFQSMGGYAAPALNCSISSISSILLANANITYAVAVSENGTWFKPSPSFPDPAVGLPELCAININVTSSPSSSYNFGLFLPRDWNSRFLTSGNGGFSGGINWIDMTGSSLSGFASMSTDTGHISASPDATWALNRPESQIDWAHRAMHGSVELAKLITQKYYGSNIKYSYFSACSTGGRQGLKEVQMYPNDFDGVISAAPAWWTSHLQPWSVEVGLWNLPVDSPHHISSPLFPVIAAEVLRQCDPQDGLTDGIISDPQRCHFIPETLLCTPSSSSTTCLSAPQLKTLSKFYKDWVETNNTFMFPSYPLGAESQYPFLLNTESGVPSAMGTTWVENFVLNKTVNSWLNDFSLATVELGDSLNPGNANADDFDLSPFAARGGKLLMYHGLADGLIPATSSIYFYNSVIQTLVPKGVSVSDFYKFYLIPGMQHCSGSVGDAPWYLGGGGQYTKVLNTKGEGDARSDVLKALMKWVEEGVAPQELVVTKWVDDDALKGVKRQRPVCAYPMQARYDGKGDPDLEGSWVCKSLY